MIQQKLEKIWFLYPRWISESDTKIRKNLIFVLSGMTWRMARTNDSITKIRKNLIFVIRQNLGAQIQKLEKIWFLYSDWTWESNTKTRKNLIFVCLNRTDDSNTKTRKNLIFVFLKYGAPKADAWCPPDVPKISEWQSSSNKKYPKDCCCDKSVKWWIVQNCFANNFCTWSLSEFQILTLLQQKE